MTNIRFETFLGAIYRDRKAAFRTRIASDAFGECVASSNPGAFDKGDRLTWEAIQWEKSFKADGIVKKFLFSFIEAVPKHGLEHTDGTFWSAELQDPDGILNTSVPCPGNASGQTASGFFCVPDNTGSQDSTSTSTTTPVWVLDRDGKVHINLTAKSY